MLNPCCCLSPRIGALIFGIIDMVVAVLYVWGTITSLLDHGFREEMIGEIIMSVVLLIMALLLLLGAWKNEAEKIKLWLILWIVYVIVVIALQVLNISTARSVNPRQGGSLATFLVFLYQIWVVYAYLVELRAGPAGLTYCPTQITV